MADGATSRATGSVLAERLADAVRRAGRVSSGPVVLLGDPALTGPAWDAVLDPLPGEWRRVWRPRDAAALLGGLRAASPPGPWTVVRVDDLRRVLLPDDDELAVEVASALRGALRRPDAPMLLAASVPPDPGSWRRLTQAPASGGHDRLAQARELLRDAVILTTGPPRTASGSTRSPSAAPPSSAAPSSAAPSSAASAGPQEPAGSPARAAEPATAAGPDRWWEHLPPRAPWPPERPEPSEEPELSEQPEPSAQPGEPGPPSAAGSGAVGVPLPAADRAPEDDRVAEDDRSGDDRPRQDRPVPGEPPAAAAPPSAGGPEPEPAAGGTGPAGVAPAPEGAQGSAREVVVTMSEVVARLAFPRWRPTALPPGGQDRPAPEELRRQGLSEEGAGNLAGAVRLYERAAQEGDLVALGRLAALRSGTTPDEAAEEMFRQAAQERNTAVLFGLAAAGHAGALELLTRLRDEADVPPPE